MLRNSQMTNYFEQPKPKDKLAETLDGNLRMANATHT